MRYLHHVSVVEVSRDGNVLQPDATDQPCEYSNRLSSNFPRTTTRERCFFSPLPGRSLAIHNLLGESPREKLRPIPCSTEIINEF